MLPSAVDEYPDHAVYAPWNAASCVAGASSAAAGEGAAITGNAIADRAQAGTAHRARANAAVDNMRLVPLRCVFMSPSQSGGNLRQATGGK